MGIAKEKRKFKPHLTIARFKNVKRSQVENFVLSDLSFKEFTFMLFKVS